MYKIALNTTTYIILALLLAACGISAAPNPGAASLDSPIPTTTILPTSPPEPTPANEQKVTCSVDSLPDFAGYASWTKINPQPIDGHEVKVDIYLNDLARDIYTSASGEVFPDCAAIVKTHLDGDDTIAAMTVMVKMTKGFDPEHNDWWWGMYDSQGKTATMSGKVQVCIDCHEPASAEDFVFSQKVMDEVNKQ